MHLNAKAIFHLKEYSKYSTYYISVKPELVIFTFLFEALDVQVGIFWTLEKVRLAFSLLQGFMLS